MHDLHTMITESTCGEACWEAREDVCRCSCGGKNHSIFRSGQRPERTRKLNGWIYQLVSVEAPGASCMAVGERPLMQAKDRIVQAAIDAGEWSSYKWDSEPGYPAKIKTASDSEVQRWEEFAGHRQGPWRPVALWVRCDMVKHLAEEVRTTPTPST